MWIATHTLLAKFGLAPPLEGSVGHPQLSRRRPIRQFPSFPGGHNAPVIFAPVLEIAPKVHTLGLGCCDSLGLPLAIKFPFRLSYIGKQLKDDIGDQNTGQVPALAGIQQRHIQNHNGHLFLLGQQPPLLQNFVIAASQPVDALDNKGVSGF